MAVHANAVAKQRAAGAGDAQQEYFLGSSLRPYCLHQHFIGLVVFQRGDQLGPCPPYKLAAVTKHTLLAGR